MGMRSRCDTVEIWNRREHGGTFEWVVWAIFGLDVACR